ncbi:MAG: hypothetical protein ACYTGB_14800 [Planctomycetota bacterium]|jgi:hypothetical protein
MPEKQRETVRAAVLAAAKTEGDRRTLSCADAHHIADEQSVDRRLVGEICNDEGIRVVACQLGLFP